MAKETSEPYASQSIMYNKNQEQVDLGEPEGGSNHKKRNKIIGIVVVLLLLAAVITVIVYFAEFHGKASTDSAIGITTPAGSTTPVVSTTSAGPTTPIFKEPDPEPTVRVDCIPELPSKDEATCQARGCRWDGQASNEGDKCFVSLKDRGFQLTSATTQYSGGLTELNLEWIGESKAIYSNAISQVKVTIEERDDASLRIKFTDNARSRFEVPMNITVGSGSATPNYEVRWAQPGGDEKFYIQVLRKSDNTTVFDTKNTDLIFEDQFLSLSTKAPSDKIFGFGENVHQEFRHDLSTSHTYGLFARDQGPGSVGLNLYGVHPFYTCIEDSGNAHGIFLLNSNAQDYTITSGGLITYRTIGGVLDFFIFTGPTPKDVIKQYTQLIGRPFFPPYWSLGFQICRYGYKDTDDIRQVVERTRAANIPHDVQYADIDYMDARKDFTLNSSFADLPEYFADLRANYSMKTIIILDPALSIQEGYPIYPEGKNYSIYIKWPQSNNSYDICVDCADEQNNMLGYVWPDNKTVFPDFFKSNTSYLWTKWIVDERAIIPFDGLWIDMNEPANFDTNMDRPWNWPTQRPNESDWNLKCDTNNTYENPPYLTKAIYGHGADKYLSDKTLCMVGMQGENDEYRHYDVHNLYGWSQSLPTLIAMQEALKQNGDLVNGTEKRGMIISRSTFPGSGKWVGHWLGDNSAVWNHLRESIIGMLEFNLFGIPYVGADIGGFFQNSTAEMTKRWMQLGAFYPFSRNHNGIFWVDHDPAAWNDTEVTELSRQSLETRYKLLPYLYTRFYLASSQGELVVGSLQFEWPADSNAMNISEQFLWGDAILFSPILYEGQTELKYYLPTGETGKNETWYDYYTRTTVETGQRVMNVQSDTEIPIHLRGGKIIPIKESALTTTISRKTKFSLLVPLDETMSAAGFLYWDGGDEKDATSSSCEVELNMQQTSAGNFTIGWSVAKADCIAMVAAVDGADSPLVDSVIIMGFPAAPSNATSNGEVLNHVYNTSSYVLEVREVNESLFQPLSINIQ